MTNCEDKFCKPLSNGLCNEQLAFGSLHDCANYLILILKSLIPDFSKRVYQVQAANGQQQ